MEDIKVCVKRGLSVVESESGREALTSLYEGDFLQSIEPTASLNVFRLTRDEVGYRPIAVVGDLASVTPAAVRAAPRSACEGVFGNFRIPAAGLDMDWVALPPWSIVTLSRRPVILSVSDCAAGDVKAALNAKSREEIAKIQGTGLLVLDVGNKVTEISRQDYYVVEDGDKVRLLPGTDSIPDVEKVIAKVLFLCRPPGKENVTTSELLQV